MSTTITDVLEGLFNSFVINVKQLYTEQLQFVEPKLLELAKEEINNLLDDTFNSLQKELQDIVNTKG